MLLIPGYTEIDLSNMVVSEAKESQEAEINSSADSNSVLIYVWTSRLSVYTNVYTCTFTLWPEWIQCWENRSSLGLGSLLSVLRLAERVPLYWGLLGVSDDIICHHPQQIPVPSPPGLIPECVSTSPLGSLRRPAYRNIGLNHGLLDQKDLDSSPASAFTYIQ